MRGLLIVFALGLLVFYAWGAAAFWQAAVRERLKLLWVVTIWNILAALGSLFFLVGTLGEAIGLLGLLGAAFGIATPFLWSLGRVNPRLRQYGLSFTRIYSFSR
ncbi:MAG: hypothetical protein KatS3mg057_3027 [Herpetosiphonaceae bacterium]|nr:MAG: hypothetical protein KatS3mg057_3027 [Herpetosiphonaceae bacterium]